MAHRADEVQPGIPAGDVIFQIQHKPHPTFKPHNSHPSSLRIDVNISLSEALLGINRVCFKHLDGRGIRIESKRGERVISQGEACIIRSEGLPMRGRGKGAVGDLWVYFNIEMPSVGWASRTDPGVSQVLDEWVCDR